MGRSTVPSDMLGIMGKWGQGPSYGPMLKEDRAMVFGLDCPQSLEWRNWRPGNEYERTLIMKNIGTKSAPIKYKLPESKYFSMDFPEPTRIGAGLTWAVKVIFRPVKMEPYEDEVTFLLPNGSFSVPLIAWTPELGIQVPAEIGFGYQAVKEQGSRTFPVRNSGDLPVTYHWKVEEPFNITPSKGTIGQGAVENFLLTFAPKEASVFSAKAVCVIDDGPSGFMAISGIGKFPHLQLEQGIVIFGELYTGQQSTKPISLHNPSLVPANFETHCISSTGPKPVCRLQPSCGCIAPGEHQVLHVTYAPTATGVHTVDSFEFSTPGGNRVTLSAEGDALGVVVSLNVTSLNFGSLEVGQVSTRSLSLTNESKTPARYEFQADPLGVFSFGLGIRGVLPPLFTVSLSVEFRPTAPSNHWKRVLCLVGSGDPVFVDLIGTAFTDRLRPAPLTIAHVEEYLDRVAMGGNPLRLEGADASSRAQSRAQSAAPSMMSEMDRQLRDRPGAGELSHWEQLFHGHDASRPLVADTDRLDFGGCSRLRPADYKSVSLTNRCTGKLTVYSTVPRWQDPDGAISDPVFQVFPDVADVRPGEAVTFRVAFRPPRDGQYYHGILDFVAHVKHMRSFRLVGDHNFNAPFNVAVAATGNTFLHTTEEFSPKFELSTAALNFPPVRVGESVHQTIELINKGDTAVMFDFQDKQMADIFQVSPRAGRVPRHTTVLVGLRFCPPAAQQYSRSLPCCLNNSLKAAMPLQLIGAGYLPQLSFDLPGSTLYFKPTCVGAASTRPLIMRNPSAIPLMFSWSLPPSLAGTLSIEPTSGIVQGKASVALDCTFAPLKKRTYTASAGCLVRTARGLGAGAQALETALQQLSLDSTAFEESVPITVVGEGTTGSVTVEPAALSLGTVLAGEAVSHEVTLLNHSVGVLRYRLEVLEEATGKTSPMGSPKSRKGSTKPTGMGPDVSADQPEGVLYARTPKTLTITMQPKTRGLHCYKLLVYTAVGEGLGSDVPTATASIDLTAAFPLLQVADAFCFGRPKPLLWQQLGLHELNTELGSALSKDELKILRALADGKDVPTASVLARLEPKEIRFGAHAQGDAPTVVHLNLANPADALPLQWSLAAQDSAGVEMENWVEAGVPQNDTERNLAFISEHRIFEYFPEAGNLPPGASTRLTITYKHIAPGLHELPLLLQVEQGKMVKVVLQGATVSPQVQAIAAPVEHHTFLPVPIGQVKPPMQVVPMYNGGPAPVEYSLDLSVLDQLRADNREVDVLRLASPASGVIPPGRAALLNWVLAPVEVDEVVVDIPVRFSNGKGTTLSLMGRGYHPDVPSAEQEKLPGEAMQDMASWKSFSFEPHMYIPGVLASLSAEVLSLGCMPVNAVQRRCVILSNVWDLPVHFEWDLDQMHHNAGCIDGVLEVNPSVGRLEAGERQVCKLVFKSGLNPQVFAGDIRCRLEPTEDAVEMNNTNCAAGMAALAEKERQEGAPEVVAIHPAPETGRQARTRPPGSQRLPVHMAMTKTVQNQFDSLKKAAITTLTRMQATHEAAAAPREIPAAHDLILHLHGRVLVDPQLEAAVVCVASETETSLNAHAGCSWRVPTVEELVKEPAGPLPGFKDVNPAGPSPWPAAELGMATAVAVLMDLILESVASPEVEATVAALEEEEVPRFAQVSDMAGTIISEAGDVPRPPPPALEDAVLPPLKSTPEVSAIFAEAPGPEPGTEEEAAIPPEALPEEKSDMLVDETVPLEAMEAEAEEGAQAEAEEAKLLMRFPEVQVFAEFVLESALYGLVQESVLDEWMPLNEEA